MDAVISYLVKFGSLLLLFSLVYYLLLRKETFFRSNRFFLLSGLLVSTFLPLITFTKIIWKELQPLQAQTAEEGVTMIMPHAIQKEHLVIDWWLVISIIYLLGALFFIGQFIIDYYLVRRVLTGRAIRREGKFRIVETTEDLSPFSYFNYILYNPAYYSEAELENILEHEKTHCREYHSLDVLFTRLCCIAFWFNPIIWLYKSQIIQNLEFIADAEANRHISDRKNYQITLLKVTARENCLAFTNHFYQSLIKKRIVMLNKKQSRKRSLWKYGIVIPLLLAFMLQFQVNVIAQEKKTDQKSALKQEPKADLVVADIDSDFTDEQLNEGVKKLAAGYRVNLEFSGIKRDKNGNITYIIAIAKDKKGQTKKYATAAYDGDIIKPFCFYVNNPESENMTFGFKSKADMRMRKAIADEQYYLDENKDTVVMQSTRESSGVIENDIEQTAEDDSFSTTENNTKNPLLIIGGKQYPSFNMKEYTFECDGYILKLSQEEGIRKYGEKAKDGVLIFKGNTIIKKRGTSIPVAQLTSSGEEIKTTDKPALQTTYSPLFVINRKSDDKELQHYTEQLALQGLRLEISGTERNAKGEITAIKILLTDLNDGTGGQSKWNAPANGQGIPNITIGKADGKVIINASK